VSDVAMSQKQQLADGVVRWKNAFALGDFAQLAVVGLNEVVGVDEPPNFEGDFEKGDQFRPVVLPGFDGDEVHVLMNKRRSRLIVNKSPNVPLA
jgi:hypothetical protein